MKPSGERAGGSPSNTATARVPGADVCPGVYKPARGLCCLPFLCAYLSLLKHLCPGRTPSDPVVRSAWLRYYSSSDSEHSLSIKFRWTLRWDAGAARMTTLISAL